MFEVMVRDYAKHIKLPPAAPASAPAPKPTNDE
jgi:hypothetical protein